jgi:hypothetical protein
MCLGEQDEPNVNIGPVTSFFECRTVQKHEGARNGDELYMKGKNLEQVFPRSRDKVVLFSATILLNVTKLFYKLNTQKNKHVLFQTFFVLLSVT